MNKYYLDLFNKKSKSIENDIYYFGLNSDGDCFDTDDVKEWCNNSFYNNLHSKSFLNNEVTRRLLETLVKKGQPTVELACGPGMGLIPSIKQLNPLHICMATDASSLLINQWKKYTSENEMIAKLDFAQFSICMRMLWSIVNLTLMIMNLVKQL